MLFRNSNKENKVSKVRIIKTSAQAQHEEKIRKETERLQSICPECGSANDVNPFTYNGECRECGCEWKVNL